MTIKERFPTHTSIRLDLLNNVEIEPGQVLWIADLKDVNSEVRAIHDAYLVYLEGGILAMVYVKGDAYSGIWVFNEKNGNFDEPADVVKKFGELFAVSV